MGDDLYEPREVGNGYFTIGGDVRAQPFISRVGSGRQRAGQAGYVGDIDFLVKIDVSPFPVLSIGPESGGCEKEINDEPVVHERYRWNELLFIFRCLTLEMFDVSVEALQPLNMLPVISNLLKRISSVDTLL